MKRIGTKQIVPLLLTVFAVVFAVTGLTQLRFWSDVGGLMPGFFPAIMAIVMFLTGITSSTQSSKDKGSTRYERNELLVIIGGVGIIVGGYTIGLLPSCYLFITLWLRVFEYISWKDTLIVLVVCVAIPVGVFCLWLRVHLPMGLLEYIL